MISFNDSLKNISEYLNSNFKGWSIKNYDGLIIQWEENVGDNEDGRCWIQIGFNFSIVTSEKS